MADAAAPTYEVVRTNDEQQEKTAIEIADIQTKDVDDVKKDSPPKSSFWNAIDLFFANTHEVDDNDITPPNLTLLELFKVFLWIGCRAFGGPVAQIAMMKQELVTEGKWLSEKKFQRVYAIYQVLPGPEAMELACYFGYIAGGRIGGFLGGLGFLLPGVLLMLLWSYLYVTFGLADNTVQASFRCVQIAVSAIIFRGTYKLGEGALKDKKAKAFSWESGYLFLFCFLTSVIRLNFFITLAVCGIMNCIYVSEGVIPYKNYAAFFISCVTIGFYILYCQLRGMPDGSMLGGGLGGSAGSDPTSFRALFELGLIAGMVTFGGAYTTLPFIYTSAVTGDGWLSQRQFLDAIAITNMMPTPLVSFVTMVGWVGHGIGGAVLMDIGIFLPAFSFTIIGHSFFERVVENKFVEPFLDGVAAAVIGLLFVTAFQFLRSVVVTGIDAVVFFLAFWAAFNFTDKYTQPIILLIAAIAGQALYA